jgi:hypothetical protein
MAQDRSARRALPRCQFELCAGITRRDFDVKKGTIGGRGWMIARRRVHCDSVLIGVATWWVA